MRVEAITVVAGNVHLDRAVKNALVAVEMAGTGPVLVCPGAARPLCRQLETAVDVHGEDGLSGLGFEPRSGRACRNVAVRTILDLTERYPHELTLVALGPLTNIAAALAADPELPARVKELYIMGGTGDGQGNVTPVAEYNFWADPEAARSVVTGGFNAWLVGWDVARRDGILTDRELEELRRSGTERARFAVDSNLAVREFCREVTRIDGVDFPDPVTMALVLEPELGCGWDWVCADVETGGGLTRGQLVLDRLGLLKKAPNLHVCRGAGREGFKRLLFRLMKDKGEVDGGEGDSGGPVGVEEAVSGVPVRPGSGGSGGPSGASFSSG